MLANEIGINSGPAHVSSEGAVADSGGAALSAGNDSGRAPHYCETRRDGPRTTPRQRWVTPSLLLLMFEYLAM